MSPQPILASGGLVFRAAGEDFEILVIHRPRYDDWSLPKGKDDPGERPEQAAVREVEEETGVRARIIAPLGESKYRVRDGEKLVRYFAMRPVEDRGFRPNGEVDEIRWVAREDAPGLLTYQRDVDLVEAADLEGLSKTGKVFLVRHAAAGDRSTWEGDDALRPLSQKGRRQAHALAGWLRQASIDRLLSSPAARCRQTLEPLGEALGIGIEDQRALAEGSSGREALRLFEETAGDNLVASSHGDVIPEVLEMLLRRGVELRSPNGKLEYKKASIWQLHVVAGEVASGVYHPPPKV